MDARLRDWPGGPAYQVFGSDGSFRFTRFVLNPDFREMKFVIVDVGGSKDVVAKGREISGAHPRYQLFNGSGNLLVTQFVLNLILPISGFCGGSGWRWGQGDWIWGIETKGL
jgi:hypothetical protein